MARADEILSFWFGQLQDSEQHYDEQRRLWFASDPAIDQDIKDRFFTDYQQAADNKLAHWQNTPRTALALILLYDQFPRNMFRGDPRAFATDQLARAVTFQVLNTTGDTQLQTIERMFIYMPLMHSEDLDHQRQSVELFQHLARVQPYLQGVVSYAVRHREIIERFGRFPHRNVVLGRPSTPEELDFLSQPGSPF